MIGRLLEKDLRELWDNPEFIKKILSYLRMIRTRKNDGGNKRGRCKRFC